MYHQGDHLISACPSNPINLVYISSSLQPKGLNSWNNFVQPKGLNDWDNSFKPIGQNDYNGTFQTVGPNN